jgi:hypothetical protein
MGLLDFLFSKKKESEDLKDSYSLFIVLDEHYEEKEHMEAFEELAWNFDEYDEIGCMYDWNRKTLLEENDTLVIDRTPCFILTRDGEDTKNMLLDPIIKSYDMEDVIVYLKGRRTNLL